MKYILLLIILSLTSHSIYANMADFVLCFDFGCKSTKEVNFNSQQWDKITQIFTPPAISPWLEKQQIRQAIALMENYSGAIIGTNLDKGGNYSGQDLPFQQDCIDESTNTLQYLSTLQRKDLLHWHLVGEKKRRIVWFATHWTATILDIKSNEYFAVDSWYLDNGERPYVQKLKNWKRKNSFSDLLNP